MMIMNYKDIRWKQRFKNFEAAFKKLTQAIELLDGLDDLSKEGLIQRFEYTFELAWKTLKDYLESKGENVKFPRDVIKKAFQAEIINNGELWLEMLEKRNLLSHIYDENTFNTVMFLIQESYYSEIKNLYNFLLNEQ